MADFRDVSKAGDGSVMLKVLDRGAAGERPGDFAVCDAHFKFLEPKKKGGGFWYAGGSKEEPGVAVEGQRRVAYQWQCWDVAVFGQEIVPTVNARAAPKAFVLGEGEVPESVELAVRHLGAGGKAQVQLAAGALPGGRPAGKLTLEVKLVRWQAPCRGPGTPGWTGLGTVANERLAGEDFLAEAQAQAGAYEALKGLMLDAAALSEAGAAAEAAAKKNSYLAARRFQHARAWAEPDGSGAHEQALALKGLAQAIILNQKTLCEGVATPYDLAASPPAFLRGKERALGAEAKACAKAAHDLDPLDPQAVAILGLAHLELGEAEAAEELCAKALGLDRGNAAARACLTAVALREKRSKLAKNEAELKAAGGKLEASVKKKAKDVPQLLAQVGAVVGPDKVTFDAVRDSKVGKSVKVVQKDAKMGADAQAAANGVWDKLVALTDARNRQII